jgi:hypothetical protein
VTTLSPQRRLDCSVAYFCQSRSYLVDAGRSAGDHYMKWKGTVGWWVAPRGEKEGGGENGGIEESSLLRRYPGSPRSRMLID